MPGTYWEQPEETTVAFIVRLAAPPPPPLPAALKQKEAVKTLFAFGQRSSERGRDLCKVTQEGRREPLFMALRQGPSLLCHPGAPAGCLDLLVPAPVD